jgi:hypothetical protein
MNPRSSLSRTTPPKEPHGSRCPEDNVEPSAENGVNGLYRCNIPMSYLLFPVRSILRIEL